MSAVRKQVEVDTDPDDLRPEYDFSQLPESRPRGYYAARYAAGPVITPDGVVRRARGGHRRWAQLRQRVRAILRDRHRHG